LIPLNTIKTICEAFHIAPEQITEYPASSVMLPHGRLIMCKLKDEKKIIAEGEGGIFSELDGTLLEGPVRVCPLSHENRLALNEYLPYTKPVAFGTKVSTFGMGDRLGLASPAHIRSVKNSGAKPVLAQQSKRELELTGRNYTQVLDDACFAVFQEGYQDGFGADGDHLKYADDIKDALAQGYTMITLDCSEKIGKDFEPLSMNGLCSGYQLLPTEYRMRIEESYLKKKFLIAGTEYSFTDEELYRCALVYHGVIDFASEIYRNILSGAEHAVDFELSVDETESVTTPHAHIFTAMELLHQKVKITSLAPKFIGEFQKGIDYIGNITEFEAQFSEHAAIASHFGYKLSVHSGSDKFRVFPLIGKYSAGNLHLKTSGTSWLEAVGTIAECNPALYRRIHEKALACFDNALHFYHVTANPEKIAGLCDTGDDELIEFLRHNDSRQLLHITYGAILAEHHFKQEIYKTLELHEEHYMKRLALHMDRHLLLTGLKRTAQSPASVSGNFKFEQNEDE
jgi:hypothetical protein